MTENIPVVREDGWIAIQHFTSNPATVQIEASGQVYTFSPQHNVSMAWVNPDDVPAILQIRARICCGKTKQKFQYASQVNVCLWETGERC